MSDFTNQKSVLITGGAGFIGSHLVDTLLDQNYQVTALDNFSPFYDRSLKEKNIARALQNPNFQLVEGDILDTELLDGLGEYDAIVHLAARAGVRPSIKDPVAYQVTNVQGTQNMLEFARKRNIKQFVFASSSSVYGISPKVPWSESDAVLMPISPYASTKVSGELMGHVYSHLYDIRFIALRFFTVFGPRQRPDLAINKFARMILDGEEIPVYGDGSTRRDYTYVHDIVQGVMGAINYTQSKYEVINLGNGNPVLLRDLISDIEEVLNLKADINRLPEQPGDVPQTLADIKLAQKLLNYQPQTSFKEGVEKFVEWHKSQKEKVRL
ncbi:MAG: GDP-mannose 4,6-dehydratase [Bacteroidetes bacterium]|nr:GDP-mannose 4,6-dehydratase [Bacteroidota bacterium]